MSNEAHTPDNVDPNDENEERKAYASPVCYAHEFESALAERAAMVPAGVHQLIVEQATEATVTVAGKPSVEVPPGTLSSILKQAGLKK